MTAIAPIMQAFFTDRLMSQLHASPHTIASYRDTMRLLLAFARQQHQLAIHARESRKRSALVDFGDRYAPIPFGGPGGPAQHFAGPAEAVLPALAAVFGGRDQRRVHPCILLAARRGGKLPPSLLTQLPAADMYNAVYRRVGGCEVPIVVKYGVSGL